MADFGEILGSVAKGAAAGSVVPGIGTAIGAVGGLAMGIAPELGKWLFGDKAAQTISQVQQAVTAVTGTSDEQAQIAAIEKDPQAAATLRIQLAQIAAAREKEERDTELAAITAQLADTAGARQQTMSLAAAHSVIAYGAPIISVVVLCAFGVCMWLSFTLSVQEANRTIIDQLVGTLGAMSMAVVSYWVGSTANSAQKTLALATSVPGDVARKLLPNQA